jgi:hypothetical protein
MKILYLPVAILRLSISTICLILLAPVLVIGLLMLDSSVPIGVSLLFVSFVLGYIGMAA